MVYVALVRSKSRHSICTTMITMIEPLTSIRRNSSIYLPGGVVRADILCQRVVADILFLPGASVLTTARNPWWIVASDCDWVERYRRERSVNEFFTTVSAFPERSVNDLHGEVIVAAFAKVLITATAKGTVENVVGDACCDAVLTEISKVFPSWERLLAFQLQDLPGE